MSNYPNLSDGKPLRQTTKRTVSCSTGVYRFMDMSEARYVSRTPVARFDANYLNLLAADYAAAGPTHSIQDFHDAMQGRFDNFNLTFAGTMYTNMYFDQDTVTFQEKAVNWYTTEVRLKQFPATGFPSITVSDPSLPTLGNGTAGPQNQYPNPLSHMQSNVIVDLDDAVRFSYHRINSPIPMGELQLKAITDAELAILEAFFIQMAGRYGLFSLIYNGQVMTGNVRFNTDDFAVDYSQGPNCNSVNLPWVVVPA